MPSIPDIAAHISAATAKVFDAPRAIPVSGGCINSAYVLENAKQRYFIKTHSVDKYEMFAAEAAGLGEIAATRSVRVPTVICFGRTADEAYLVLEYIALSSGGKNTARQLGVQLAAMHQHSVPRFGWRMNNTIGSTPQINSWSESWPDFFARQRLGYQLSLNAGRDPALMRLGEELLPQIKHFFSNCRVVPALLHGDLWGGNWAAGEDGVPVIFDPALYFGDREADIAMTELFGGFPPDFYAAYRDAYPLDPAYRVRKQLYNLYHVLNHDHLFGGAYAAQARQMIQSLLAELR